MSRFFSEKYRDLTPYTPGEQPKDNQYIKLNTNESPFPPSEQAVAAAAEAAKQLQLYNDPTCARLTAKTAQTLGVAANEVLMTNGSDEILNFAFQAFCDKDHPAVFPDVTYGFYMVFAQVNGVPYREIPLDDDFNVRIEDYFNCGGTIFLANPNAPTGKALPLSDIEKILQSNPDNVVVIDEAYVDFGGESAVPLIRKYTNLLVTQTFSKSRSLAGGRLGFGVGCKALMQDLNTIKYSTNPYNVNTMTQAMGIVILDDEARTKQNCAEICKTRAYATKALESLGFSVLPSQTNFVFAKSDRIGGEELYRKLKERGVLVRHFDAPRLKDYNRITIGSREQMDALLACVKQILEETT